MSYKYTIVRTSSNLIIKEQSETYCTHKMSDNIRNQTYFIV